LTKRKQQFPRARICGLLYFDVGAVMIDVIGKLDEDSYPERHPHLRLDTFITFP